MGDALEGDAELEAAEALLVECASCATPTSWRVLRLNDGICIGCAQPSASPPSAPNVSAPAADSSCASQASGSAALVALPVPAEDSCPTGSGEAKALQQPRSAWRARRREVAAKAC